MANLRENLSTFRAVSEGPSFWAGLISAVILGVSGLILLWLAVPEGSFSLRVPWQLVPVVLSTVIIAVIYYLGTVNYAFEQAPRIERGDQPGRNFGQTIGISRGG